MDIYSRIYDITKTLDKCLVFLPARMKFRLRSVISELEFIAELHRAKDENY